MRYKIEKIGGIGRCYEGKLGAAEITSTDALLKQYGSPKGPGPVAEATELDEGQLLEWSGMADLVSSSGIGERPVARSHGVDTGLKER